MADLQFECELDVGPTTVSKDACKAWYGGLLAAKKTETSVVLYFETSAAGYNGPACNALSPWAAVAPYHMDL